MVFPWSLSDSKSPQVSWTHLSILADPNNAVVWTVSTRPVIFKSSSPCTNPFGNFNKGTNYNWYRCHFHVPQFFQFSSKVQVLILLFTFFQFHSVVPADNRVPNSASSLFLLIIIRSGLLGEIRWSVCISKFQRGLCVSFCRTDSWLCIYHLFVRSNFNFLQNSQLITWSTKACLVSHSFCANLLHSLIMWLIVSSLSPHNLHLLFCCVLSILAFIWLVLMALFCAAIRKDSVSRLRFLFLSHVHVFSWEIPLVSHLKRP